MASRGGCRLEDLTRILNVIRKKGGHLHPDERFRKTAETRRQRALSPNQARFQIRGSTLPLAVKIEFDRRGNDEVSVKNSKSQITNNKQITMTKIQNDKPVWV
ncbi:MAG: hypothetical protein ABF292_12460, partial [Desulfobacterales bacterium]